MDISLKKILNTGKNTCKKISPSIKTVHWAIFLQTRVYYILLQITKMLFLVLVNFKHYLLKRSSGLACFM